MDITQDLPKSLHPEEEIRFEICFLGRLEAGTESLRPGGEQFDLGVKGSGAACIRS